MCVKDCFEIVYYIAFILLTTLLVVYAVKTYLFQIKSTTALYCKLFVPPDDLDKVEQLLCLEIYNHGNTPAKNVYVALNGEDLTTIDYIRPEKRAVLVIGYVTRMLNCNRVYIRDTEITENATVQLVISAKNGGAQDTRLLQTSALFLHSGVIHNEDERIASAVENLNKTLEKAFDSHHIGPGHNTFRDELCRIADSIEKAHK